ncbi:MAG: Transcriptional regulatory protein DegU [Bacteroidota bacterium]|nr:Transcriptional regulatory protein DegU [Bacteroidota bacterium]
MDDHQMLIDGLKALLSDESHISLVGESNLPKVALREIAEYRPDIVLTDINMPEMDGVELTQEIKKLNFNTKVIALSMFGERETISDMLKAGVSGYILKNTGKAELLAAIEKVADGQTYFSDEVNDEMSKSPPASVGKEVSLTPREIEVIELIAKEYTNAKIAEALFISERTVETHRKNIFRKTDTKGVIALLKYCVEKRIIKPLK